MRIGDIINYEAIQYVLVDEIDPNSCNGCFFENVDCWDLSNERECIPAQGIFKQINTESK